MTGSEHCISSNDPSLRLVFLHIPKTAGMAINGVLLPILRQKGYAPDAICPSVGRSLATIPDEQMARYQLFSGHYYYDHLERIPGPKQIFTVLREPRERLLSLYDHLRSYRREVIRELDQGDTVESSRLHAHGANGPRFAKSLGLREYLLSDDPTVQLNADNAMTKYLVGTEYVDGHGKLHLNDDDALNVALANLERFTAVGVTEGVGAFLRRLETILGITLPGTLPRVNDFASLAYVDPASYEVIASVRAGSIDSATEEAIFMCTRIDRHLYTSVLSTFKDVGQMAPAGEADPVAQ